VLGERPASVNSLSIAAAAEEDYAAALSWYAARSQQAAFGFEAEFERALQSIAASPDSYPLCDDRHRFFLMQRYPFQIIYRKVAEESWLVIAVAHASRRPGYWSER
jgi:plasmid stabilization system protein ParE